MFINFSNILNENLLDKFHRNNEIKNLQNLFILYNNGYDVDNNKVTAELVINSLKYESYSNEAILHILNIFASNGYTITKDENNNFITIYDDNKNYYFKDDLIRNHHFTFGINIPTVEKIREQLY